jgi:hypothetical protein
MGPELRRKRSTQHLALSIQPDQEARKNSIQHSAFSQIRGKKKQHLALSISAKAEARKTSGQHSALSSQPKRERLLGARRFCLTKTNKTRYNYESMGQGANDL